MARKVAGFSRWFFVAGAEAHALHASDGTARSRALIPAEAEAQCATSTFIPTAWDCQSTLASVKRTQNSPGTIRGWILT